MTKGRALRYGARHAQICVVVKAIKINKLTQAYMKHRTSKTVSVPNEKNIKGTDSILVTKSSTINCLIICIIIFPSSRFPDQGHCDGKCSNVGGPVRFQCHLISLFESCYLTPNKIRRYSTGTYF
jgi:hypothetical protein